MGKDYDGEEHKDDSYLPVSQACPQVIIPFDPFEEGNGHKLCTSHGTSMLSFVTGNYLGTSKTIKPYLVRIPRLDPDGRGAKPSHWLDAVSLVLKRFPAKSDKTVAILSLAWHWVEEEYIKAAGYEQTDFTGWRRGLGTMIQTLIEHGVFVVTGAGNEFNVSPLFSPTSLVILSLTADARSRCMGGPPSTISLRIRYGAALRNTEPPGSTYPTS